MNARNERMNEKKNLFREKSRDYLRHLFLQTGTPESISSNSHPHSEFAWDWFALSLNRSLPLDMVEMLIDKPWDWTALSCHPHMTWEFVEKYKEKPWCWPVISSHPMLTSETVFKHPDHSWSWNELSYNRNISWNLVKTFWYKPWDWSALSSHIDVDLESICMNRFFKWSWDDFCFNPHFIFRVVNTHKELNFYREIRSHKNRELSHSESMRYTHLISLWDFVTFHLDKMHWSLITKHPCVTLEMIEETPNIPWDIHSFLFNPNICLKQVNQIIDTMEYPEYRAQDGDSFSLSRLSTLFSSMGLTSLIPLSIALSRNANIALETIMDVLERCERENIPSRAAPFNIWEVTRRSDMTIEILERVLRLQRTLGLHEDDAREHVSICWPALSRNKNFTWPIIKTHLSMPWCWFNLSMNLNITPEIVLQNNELPWSWSGLSCNPNLTLRIVNELVSSVPRVSNGVGNNVDRVLSPLLLSSHIDLTKIDDTDKDIVLASYLKSMSGNVCRILACRETSNPRHVFRYFQSEIDVLQKAPID